MRLTRLPVRLSLLFLCLAAIAGTTFLLWSSTRDADRDRAAMRTFEINARSAAVSIADLRAAQQSYVAVGQGEDFWFARVASIEKEIEERISTLRDAVTAPQAAAELEAAATALQEFMQMDLRARDFTRGRQLTLASDMIFADGFELTKKAGDAVDRALTAEQVGHDSAAAAVKRQQVIALAGAGATALLGLLLLLPAGRRPDSDPLATSAALPLPIVSDETLADLRDFGLVAAPVVPAARQVSLDRVASLCGELARIPDTRTLPSLLERAAGVLDASGIVLWIADPDGRELSPILVHGYSPQLATRLGTIKRDAENVTASAYRTSLLQTVKGDTISSGAIAVPLVGSSGCVGVMAAEIKNGGEQQESLLAAATIIAAQLATLVGPPSARVKAGAAG